MKRERAYKTVFLPQSRSAVVHSHTTLLEAATAAGVYLEGPCGGKGTCGKCRVIARGDLSEITEEERKHLSSKEIEAGFRLGCMARVLGDVEVEIPRATGMLTQQILDTGVGRSVPPSPDVKKHYLILDPPSLEDQRTDLERVVAALPEEEQSGVSLGFLREAPYILRENDFKITAALSDGRLISLEGGDTTEENYGIAFDIGTTTVVGYLMDLNTGQDLATSSIMNSQSAYGGDVIARMGYVIDHSDGLEILNRAITDGLNELIDELVRKGGIDRRNIYGVTVAGNTCMHHLFLKIDPRNIAPLPFVPVVRDPIKVQAHNLGLQVHPSAEIYMLPNIAGYVGADIVADILASGLCESKEPKLLVDIGTNGEIVLSAAGRVVACSTAAGPAFEGARISQGMRGATGAVDRVVFDEDVRYTTIDGVKPRGICGSGLLDLIAEMLRFGVIDPMGRIVDRGAAEKSAGPEITERITEEEGGHRFTVIKEDESEDGRPIYLTQRDVRELQLAKGATRTGIELLLKDLNIEKEDLSEILLAGAFGTYLRKESAVAVGMMPPIEIRRIRSIGNAAGEGAKLALISEQERKKTRKIMDQVEYVELSSRLDFTDELMEQMTFPVF